MCYTSPQIMEETENRIEPLPLPTIRRYPSYLREIRALTGKGEYDNGDVVRRLDEAGDGRFAMLAQETLTYAAPLDASVRADAVRMTPMAHTADLSSLDLSSLSEITIDMEIIALARP